jgi:AP-2 complex subunit mu-1
MRAYLSGMPECRFGLNDRVLLDKEANVPNTSGSSSSSSRKGGVELDDCQFHQCVKLGKFDTDRTISFIPPDGEFELMRYRTTENINLPFKVQPVINEVSKTRVEYKVSVRSLFNAKILGQNVVLKIPTPTNTANTKIVVSAGKAKYVGSENCIVWK